MNFAVANEDHNVYVFDSKLECCQPLSELY